MLRAYQARAGEVIVRHGGHVAQYLGDGLLVYFGWPKTWDDAAERAVRAGLGLVDAAATVHARGTPLAVRVGHPHRSRRRGRARRGAARRSRSAKFPTSRRASRAPPRPAPCW